MRGDPGAPRRRAARLRPHPRLAAPAPCGARSRRRVALAVCAALGALGLTATAAGAARSPSGATPGTASKVAALVKAASSITTLPASTQPSLADESSDSTSLLYPIVNHCQNTTANPCRFGKRSSSRKIVLLGDSHAYMWLPAVAAAGTALGDQVILLWDPGCPAASVTPWFASAYGPIPMGYYTACVAWRSKALATVKKLHPTLVLFADLTSGVKSGPGTYFTDAQWEAGLKKSVDLVRSKSTKVAVIGDIQPLPAAPEQCLAANPTSVQSCSQVNPDPAAHGHQVAEQAEAKKLKVGYVDTLPWLCTSTCSPVIGTFLPYLDPLHLDATYVQFLSRVMTAAIKGLR